MYGPPVLYVLSSYSGVATRRGTTRADASPSRVAALSEPLLPPTSITGCKDLIKSSVFVNIAEYRNIVIHRRPLKNLTMVRARPFLPSRPSAAKLKHVR